MMTNENVCPQLLADAANELEHFRIHHNRPDSAAPIPPACRRFVRSLPGNQRCMDCGRNHPEWASVTFGVLVCLQCSGRHRSYGVGTSVVRSIGMDAWTHAQILNLLEGGNAQLEGFLNAIISAGKFYATHLQHHVQAVVKAGTYRGREASRNMQQQALSTEASQSSLPKEQPMSAPTIAPIAVK